VRAGAARRANFDFGAAVEHSQTKKTHGGFFVVKTI
jgi:hypothetical protein